MALQSRSIDVSLSVYSSREAYFDTLFHIASHSFYLASSQGVNLLRMNVLGDQVVDTAGRSSGFSLSYFGCENLPRSVYTRPRIWVLQTMGAQTTIAY